MKRKRLTGGVMDPRKLLYLARVIELGSLAKAAKHLAVSQPALSKSMDRLESELGIKLLERGPMGITPTTVGELLYSHARLIREEMDLAETRIQKVGKGRARVVAFGTLPSLASSVVPLAVNRWRERHPRVLLRVVEKVQVELLVGLLRGEFDFIVGQTEFYDLWDGLKQRVLFRDRLCVFARPQHHLFRLAELSWADLAQFPWVCPMVGGRQRTVLEKLLASEGIDLPQQLIECGSIDFTKSLVAASDHLAMLPAHSVTADVSEGTIRALAITVPALRRNIAVIFRERSPLDSVSRELITHIEAIGTDLSREHSRVGADSASATAADR
jgi:LysR family transcriptional regulator of gallate degradation